MRDAAAFSDPLYTMPVDLHVHSTRSDGTFTPTQLVSMAKEKGLAAFALTDHDSVNGIEEAMDASIDAAKRTSIDAARDTGVEVIPGIELSTEYEGRDVHIVGLYYDYEDPDFQSAVNEFTQERVRRNQKMCAKMAADGIPISYEAVEAANPGAVITRANIARYLYDTHYISSIDYAFSHLIGDTCPYFIPREKISPEKAVSFLRRFGGIPILAHPFEYHLGDEGLDLLLQRLKAVGLMGIEVYYCKHSPEETEKAMALAKKYDLLPSGGSDFHGTNKPGLELGTGYGHLFVPYSLLAGIKRAKHGIPDETTKIFFCDFDGTLGTSKKDISPATREALDSFVYDRGNLFVLSSGRAMSDVKSLAERLRLSYPHMFLSGYNGAELYDCDREETFFRETLSFEMVKTAFALAKKHGLYIQTYDGDAIVTEEAGKETAYYTRYVKMPVRENALVGEHPEVVLSEEPCKCLVIDLEDPRGKIPPFVNDLEAAFPGQMNLLMSNANYLEIDPIHATKGNSLIYLCRYLGIDRKNAIAAGDAPNDVPMLDVPMLEAAGVGIGMLNGLDSAPQIERAATVITGTDNDHDGLVPILDRL